MEVGLMHLSGTSSILAAMEVGLMALVAAQVVVRIRSLLCCIRVWDIWDVRVAAGLLKVLVTVLTVLAVRICRRKAPSIVGFLFLLLHLPDGSHSVVHLLGMYG